MVPTSVQPDVCFVAAAALAVVSLVAFGAFVGVAIEGSRQAVEQAADAFARRPRAVAVTFRAIAFEEFKEIHVEPPLRSWHTTPGRIHQDG